jgi:hypothetical protein
VLCCTILLGRPGYEEKQQAYESRYHPLDEGLVMVILSACAAILLEFLHQRLETLHSMLAKILARLYKSCIVKPFKWLFVATVRLPDMNDRNCVPDLQIEEGNVFSWPGTTALCCCRVNCV